MDFSTMGNIIVAVLLALMIIFCFLAQRAYDRLLDEKNHLLVKLSDEFSRGWNKGYDEGYEEAWQNGYYARADLDK